MLNFEVNLTNHCNLNCKGCAHFCSIAEKAFYDIAVFERDCKRLSELTRRKIHFIELMGGEPLLNEQIIDFMRIAREYFDGMIKIVTNGILLPKQKAEFWEACRHYGVEIVLSVYPIKIDTVKIYKMAERYGIKITGRKEDGSETKTWYRYRMDLDGKQNNVKNFYSCHAANTYIHLMDGKLTTCHAPLNSENFNHFFGDRLHLSQQDYIDIYKAKNLREILKFLSKPIPYCRYCMPASSELTNWEVSKKDIFEWT
ncbi:MAG: 4Fe-4S cluster-binding domain-containing protein [Prevotella sp.]|nr:4Fe-4S cluster-binding domain-containing protein [Prevotella sp.]